MPFFMLIAKSIDSSRLDGEDCPFTICAGAGITAVKYEGGVAES